MKPSNSLYLLPLSACMRAVGVMLCCTAFEAAAADWTSISKTKDVDILVDMDSYNETAGIPYISTKTLFVNPQNYRKNALKFSYTESHSISQFNCTKHTIKTNAKHFFAQNKKLVGSEKGDNAFKPVMAGSKEASLESLVCQVHRMVGGH